MNKGILFAFSVGLSALAIGNVSAQAPNLQPKANTNQDIVQTQIQTLSKEVAELKQQLAESNKRDARASAIIADLQQQMGALKKAFNEHTHDVPLIRSNDQNSNVGTLAFKNLRTSGTPPQSLVIGTPPAGQKVVAVENVEVLFVHNPYYPLQSLKPASPVK